MTFGEWLKRRRQQLGLTQKELARRVSCSEGTIRKLEGDARRPSVQLARLIATHLEILPQQQAAFVAFARAEAYTADMTKALAMMGEDLLQPPPPPLPTAVWPEMAPKSNGITIKHNLPVQLTPFIGRSTELAALNGFLADPDTRLITIVGPGGIGKTRLALACGELQRTADTHFADGIFFANLNPLNEIDQIIPALAGALNFQLQSEQDGRSSQQQLLDYLRQKRLLLFLDNFEHLLDGVELITDILRSAPTVKILITSRERLHLQSEQVFPIQGLDIPEREVPEELGEYSAVQLFLQSARRNQPDFALCDGDDLTYLARICRTVVGMPLALELAASWVDTLPLAEIATELQRGLDFLQADMRDMPKRHRSVRAVINYSWQKLDDEEQDIFARLSVFRGGFTQEAAQAVAGANLRQLARLVNKSLVQSGGKDGRYQLHELLRQYGLEKLKESRQETAVRNQHSHYYCQVLGKKEQAGQDQQVVRAEIEADLANMEAAWHWAVQYHLWSNLHQAGYSLVWFYYWRMRHQEGLALYQTTVNQLVADFGLEIEDKDAAWILARTLVCLAFSYVNLGQIQPVAALLQQSQPLLQSPVLAQEDTKRDEAFWFYMKAEEAFPNHALALDYIQKSLLLAQTNGNEMQKAFTLRELSIISVRFNVEMAQKSLNEALTLVRSLNDSHFMTLLLADMGDLSWDAMDYQQSEVFYKESLTLARSQNYQQALTHVLNLSGYFSLFIGEFERGVDYLQQAIVLYQQNGVLHTAANLMMVLATAYTFSGNLPQARQCLEERLTIGETPPPILSAQARVNIWIGRYEAAHSNINGLFSAIDETGEDIGWPTIPDGPAGWLALTQLDLVAARENLQKAVDYNSQFSNNVHHQEWVVMHQAPLSRAEWGLGEHAIARQQLLEALAVSIKIRAFISLLHVLPIVPVLLAGEKDVRHKVRAIEIYALAHSHPFIARCPFFYDIAGKDMEAIESDLPPDVVAAAKARGQALDFWPTAESLLTELKVLDWGEEAD